MKIVYFGSDVFLPCFEYLTKEHEIMALYTYYNAEDYFHEDRITEKARNLGIPVYYEEIGQETIRRYFLEENCDFFFIAEYDRIINIPEDLPAFRGINVHSSLLPLGRSYYPIECAMERGFSETGVTMHKLTMNLDCGDVIDQRKTCVTARMDSIDVYLMNSANALEMLCKLMEDFETGWNGARPQAEVLPYWKRPADELLFVTHEMTVQGALEVFRKYNGMTEICINGKQYFVSAVMPGSAMLLKTEIQVKDDLWLFAVADGHLRVTVLEIARREKD